MTRISEPVGTILESLTPACRNGELGVRPDGTVTRWRFTEITADSFHWWGESLAADRKTWNVEGEFLAKRTA